MKKLHIILLSAALLSRRLHPGPEIHRTRPSLPASSGLIIKAPAPP